MKRSAVSMIILLVMVLSPYSAWALEIGIRGYYWIPDLSGNIRVDDNGIAGTELDFKDDLGFKNENIPTFEAFLQAGRHHFQLGYYQVEYSGTSVLNQSISFSGETFTVGDTIRSTLDYKTYDAMYQYDILDLENFLAGFSLGLVGRVMAFDGSAEIRSENTGLESKQDFTAPVPMLGLNLHVGLILDILEFRLLGTGMGYSGNSVIDSQAELSLNPLPFINLTGGYRFFRLDVDESDVTMKYDTSGPYAGLTIKF